MFLFFFAKWICDWFNSEKSGFFVDPSVANFELRINSVEIFFFVIKTMLLKQTGCWAKAVEMNFMDLYPLKSSILTLHWHGFNTKCHKIVIIIRYGERQWMMNIFNRHLIMRIFSCTHLFDLFFHGIMQWECNLCLNWIGRFIDVAHSFFSFYSEFWKMFWKAVWPHSQFAADPMADPRLYLDAPKLVGINFIRSNLWPCAPIEWKDLFRICQCLTSVSLIWLGSVNRMAV